MKKKLNKQAAKEPRSRSRSKANSRRGSRKGSGVFNTTGDSDYDSADEDAFRKIAAKGLKFRAKQAEGDQEED